MEQILTEIPSSIQNLDLSKINSKIGGNPPIVAGEPLNVEVAEREYRRFLALRKLFPDITLVPTGVIDEYWHQHILDTRGYANACESIFGGFMDHDPYFGTFSEEDAQENASAFEETQRLYRSVFGEDMIGEAHRCSSKDCRGGGRSLPIRK